MGEVTIPSNTSLKDNLKNLNVEKGSYQEKMKLLNQRIQEAYIKTKESPNIKTQKFSKIKTKNFKALEEKSLELNLGVEVPPDFLPIKSQHNKATKSFFSDPFDRTYGGATALTSPKKFGDTYKSAFDDLYEFGRSVSSYKGRVEDWELVQQEMEDKFGIEIPHFQDYIPEIDDKYWHHFWRNFGFDGVGGDGTPRAPYKAKIQYIENLIKKKLGELPPGMQSQFKGYDHYFDLRKQKATDIQNQMGLNMMYADSGWDKWGGMLSGTGVAAMTDPLVWGTLPISLMYGWEGGIVYAAIRTAAIEAIIGAASETIIQTQVVPYRQALGQDYTWSDARKIIGTVSATSGLFAGTLTAGVKSSIQLYKNAQIALAKTDPKIRNKIIGDIFDKRSRELGFTKLEDMPPDVAWKIIQENISALGKWEMVILMQSFPDSIRLHTPYANAVRELEEQLAEELDNPLSKNIEGNVEHMERTNASLKSIIRNEEPDIPEQPNSPIVLDETRPVMNNVRLNPDDINVDVEVFQFKTGGDKKGVLTTLRGVEKWDNVAAGTVMVWERADGRLFIADGHQRLGLAKRIKAKDPKQDVVLNAQIRREADGWTSQDVMVEAMTVNIVSGTAKAEDVARIFLKMGEVSTAQRISGRIKPTQALYQNALGLYKLGDEGFQYWLKGGIRDNIAAQVGHLVDDPKLAISILKVLERANPANINEARSMIVSALQAGIITEKQVDMFGTTIMKKSLIVERAKVYDAAIRELKKDKTIFKALVENDEAIIKSGRNKLDTEYNVEKAEQYGIVIHKIEKLANRKGELSDQLTAAARLWADGSKRKAVESFKKAIHESVERGDHKGITPSGSERSIFASQSESPARQKPKENLITEKLKVHDDPHDTNVIVKEADDQLDELKEEVRSPAEIKYDLENAKLRDLEDQLDVLEIKLLREELPSKYKINEHGIVLNPEKKIFKFSKNSRLEVSLEYVKVKDGSYNIGFDISEAGQSGTSVGVGAGYKFNSLDEAINFVLNKAIQRQKGLIQRTDAKTSLARIEKNIEALKKLKTKAPTLEDPLDFSPKYKEPKEIFDLRKKVRDQEKIVDQADEVFKDEVIKSNQLLKEEIKPGAASGERITSDTSKPLDRTQDEFFQTTTAEPPSSVLAKAKGTPSASRILDDNSIGDVKDVSGINHKILQINNVGKLYKLANKHIANIEASITNISKKFKNSSVKVNIKEKEKLLAKIKKRQEDYGKDYDVKFIGDIARGRLILDDVNEVVDELVIEGFLRKNFRVIQKKDYFVTPKKDTGYRATHYQLVTEDGLAFELQVHQRELLDVYDKFRDLPNSSYNKYKDLGRKLTPEEDADRLKLAAQEKKVVDELWSEIELKAKGLPEQRAVDIGLFDATARNQLDLTDEVVMGTKVGDDGDIVPEMKTLKQVLDDVEEDTKIIKFLKDCPGIS